MFLVTNFTWKADFNSANWMISIMTNDTSSARLLVRYDTLKLKRQANLNNNTDQKVRKWNFSLNMYNYQPKNDWITRYGIICENLAQVRTIKRFGWVPNSKVFEQDQIEQNLAKMLGHTVIASRVKMSGW